MENGVDSITVIVIIAVVIAVALAYTFWVQSVATSQIFKAKGSLCNPRISKSVTPFGNNIRVDVTLENKCTSDLVIDLVLVNKEPYTGVPTPLVLHPGDTRTISLVLERKPGTTYEISLHTTSDTTYTLLVRSP